VKSDGFTTGVDGAPIYYRCVGEGDGPPLVLFDGVGCAGYAWRYLIPHFQTKCRIVHWNYRGHGLSAKPRDLSRLEVADHAQDALRVLDAARVDRGVLLGHSMGVQVILETYRAAADRVLGLIPICGSYGHVLDTVGSQNVPKRVHLLLLELTKSPLVKQLLQAIWSAGMPTSLTYKIATLTEINPELVRPEDFRPYLEHMGEMDLEVFLRCLGGAANHSAADLLPKVAVPTLIVAGERDGFTPAWLSQRMHDEIPNAEILFVPAGTHTAPIELPELIDLRIEKFLSERLAPREPAPAVAAQ
jgi:pimeloyl-ACP methyl ester carboxylesterase